MLLCHQRLYFPRGAAALKLIPLNVNILRLKRHQFSLHVHQLGLLSGELAFLDVVLPIMVGEFALLVEQHGLDVLAFNLKLCQLGFLAVQLRLLALVCLVNLVAELTLPRNIHMRLRGLNDHAIEALADVSRLHFPSLDLLSGHMKVLLPGHVDILLPSHVCLQLMILKHLQVDVLLHLLDGECCLLGFV